MKDETLRDLIQEKKQCLRTIEFEKSRLSGINERAKLLLRELKEELESENVGIYLEEPPPPAKRIYSARLPAGTWNAAILGVLLSDGRVYTSMNDMAQSLGMLDLGSGFRMNLAGSLANAPYLSPVKENRGRFGIRAGWTYASLDALANEIKEKHGLTFEGAKQLLRDRYAAKENQKSNGPADGGGVAGSVSQSPSETGGLQSEGL